MTTAGRNCVLRNLKSGSRHPALAGNLPVFAYALSFLLLWIFSTVSFAADIASSQNNASQQSENASGGHAPVLVENAEGSVSIKVKNVEILRVDENGITVTGDIKYTGTITDTGSPPQEDGGDGGK